jgi:hypothetical protein
LGDGVFVQVFHAVFRKGMRSLDGNAKPHRLICHSLKACSKRHNEGRLCPNRENHETFTLGAV